MAKLLLDSLCVKMTRKALQHALDELPKTLHATYDDALDRIKKQNEDERLLAERILAWVSFAFRPLEVTELRHALAVTPGECEFEEANMPDEEDLTSVCAGLISIEEGSKVVRLAHYTAQAYLEEVRDKIFTNARQQVAATCLTYLSYEDNKFCYGGQHYVYDTSETGYTLHRVDEVNNCPFSAAWMSCDSACDHIDGDEGAFFHDKHGTPLALLNYAASYWARYIKDRLEKELEPLAIKFLLNDMSRRLALGPLRRLWWTTRIKGPATVVVHYDLRHLCRVLFRSQNYDLKDEDGEAWKAFLSAAELGRDQVIKIFLEETNLQSLIDNDQEKVITPVAWVSWTGNRSAVRLLLRSAGVLTKDIPESSSYTVYEAQKLPLPQRRPTRWHPRPRSPSPTTPNRRLKQR